MSSPSVKPFNPFDLSPYAPKKARMHAAAEQAAEGDAESVARLPLDGASEPAAAAEAQDDGAHDCDAAASAAAEEHPADYPAEEETPDPDIARIETSLRWLQREGGAPRLPRAVQLPPIAGLRSIDGARSRGDQFINGIRVPHSLAPERLRPPPAMRDRRDHLRGPLRVLVVALIAAPIAYYFSAGNFTLPSSLSPSQPSPSQLSSAAPAEGASEVKLASIATRVVTSRQFPLPKEEVPPSEAADYNSMLASRNRAAAPPLAPTRNAAPPAVDIPSAAAAAPESAPATAAAPEPAPAQQAAPVMQASRELSPEDIKQLVQKGQQYVAAGDLVTARQVFRRAAEAGDAGAALAMGATFDPTVLARLGTIGFSGDADEARKWYERAKSFGSPDASRRLEALAAR